jgi:hypothetical protein
MREQGLKKNGVVEGMNENLVERARSMLSNANLQQELWAEAVNTTCYLVNRSPSTTIECKIPEEVWKCHPCNYSNLKVFGCEAYALILKHQRSKLDQKNKKGLSLLEMVMVLRGTSCGILLTTRSPLTEM